MSWTGAEGAAATGGTASAGAVAGAGSVAGAGDPSSGDGVSSMISTVLSISTSGKGEEGVGVTVLRPSDGTPVFSSASGATSSLNLS